MYQEDNVLVLLTGIQNYSQASDMYLEGVFLVLLVLLAESVLKVSLS